MSFRVQIENFQSIVKADLEVSGLTTITGQNNSGKSAIMRAIRGVFSNPGNGSSYVHYGKDFFRVRITFDDGKYILWERVGRRATRGKTKGQLVDLKTNYEVNGERIDGVANSVPEVVLEQGVGPIMIGREAFWPQLAKQVKDVFFLVDRPGSHVAEAVANVDNVAVLNDAIRDCDKEIRANQSELKVRRGDLQGHLDSLEAMKGLDEVVARVEAVEKLHAQVERIKKGLDTSGRLRSKLQRAQAEVERLSPVLEIEVPDTSRHEALQEILRKTEIVRALGEKVSRARSEVEHLSGAGDLEAPDPARPEGLRAVVSELGAARGLQARLRAARADLERLSKIDNVTGLDLDEGLSKLSKVAKGLEMYGGLQGRLRTAKSTLEKTAGDLAKAKVEAQKAQDELDQFLASNPKCPTCGQFRIEHLEAS